MHILFSGAVKNSVLGPMTLCGPKPGLRGRAGAEPEHGMGEGPPLLCIIVDYNVAWLCRPLERRGVLVFCPERDYTGLTDSELLDVARRLGCILVSKDGFFEGKPCSVYISHREEYRRNSWEIVTMVIKRAVLARATCT